MRIRSIKPEFWTDEDVATWDWPTRLLFIGLWSYVDDNGVGRDNEKLIKADLFPLEEDPRDTLATVSRGLQTLSDSGRIVRYAVDGKAYLRITNWDRHQKIDRPAKDRYPLPTCENATSRETLATPSRRSRETPSTGTGEQGNRGTGEQVVPPRSARKRHLPDGWHPNEHHARIAADLELDLNDQVARFRDYDKSKGPIWKDHDAGFNNWLRNAAKWGNSNRNPYSKQQETDALFNAAMERAIARDQQEISP